MRTVLSIFLALLAAGCCTRPRQAPIPTQPVTSMEARMIAQTYIATIRGACGTGVRGVEDKGDFWLVQTVYGLEEHFGPELRIDKITRRVAVVQETSR